jgi:pyruvate/2-oxoglutarate dehydrogenase complex dihydrolipoamide dehydrogenase (E3) component
VIATGSEPWIPPIAGLSDTPFYTNETIFSLRDAPEHLIIIGGGPIGIEMAQAHIRLGCRVSVIEPFALLARDDPELSGTLIAMLEAEGIAFYQRRSYKDCNTSRLIYSCHAGNRSDTRS